MIVGVQLCVIAAFAISTRLCCGLIARRFCAQPLQRRQRVPPAQSDQHLLRLRPRDVQHVRLNEGILGGRERRDVHTTQLGELVGVEDLHDASCSVAREIRQRIGCVAREYQHRCTSRRHARSMPPGVLPPAA